MTFIFEESDAVAEQLLEKKKMTEEGLKGRFKGELLQQMVLGISVARS